MEVEHVVSTMVGWLVQKVNRITKKLLHKSLERTVLKWSELKEMLLNVEINLSRRPLTYIQEAVK